ncbi:MAG: acyl-CoA dehydrogenase [Gammaproteobacteria bacterium]|nr:MAG: acyl-CoA dehydrogenase [Gammaproteobacteria bacterium]
MDYCAPTREQLFALEAIARREDFAGLPLAECLESGLAESILGESGRFAAEVFAPLDRLGDVEGARWSPGGVTLPHGFAAAYSAYVEGGWGGLTGPTQYGGQCLPIALAAAVREQLSAANMALAVNPILTAGAIEAIDAHSSAAQKDYCLAQLVTGRWSAAMNLTEPQAGSDVGALKCSARPAADGHWLIRGTKIFISWGDHDLTDNIMHLVLARTPGAPDGTRGISLFLVPKVLPDGSRNDLRCVSLEHKLGIHASPTCTMAFGDHDQCLGWLVGEERGGMRAMFTMMNHMRINVAMQGLAVAERAMQRAVGYARERVQSAAIGGNGLPTRIIEHADVRRMLMTLRATTQATRALVYYAASQLDRARDGEDSEARRLARGRADLLTPITKAWASDIGVEMASLAIQVQGGMGYVEETGAAQQLRDARIAPIYEGTNGIQALDLVGRKLQADGGAHWRALLDEIDEFVAAAADGVATRTWRLLGEGAALLRQATEAVAAQPRAEAAAIASPYLRMWGLVLAAYLLVRQAALAARQLADASGDTAFLEAKLATADYFAAEMLPQATALFRSVTDGGAPLLFRLREEQFAN